jgi:hypothetical protein
MPEKLLDIVFQRPSRVWQSKNQSWRVKKIMSFRAYNRDQSHQHPYQNNEIYDDDKISNFYF